MYTLYKSLVESCAQPCPSSKPLPREDDDGGEKAAAPANLLEQRWFFNNLLDRKISMSINSDDHPCAPSDGSPPAGKSCDETYESIKKLSRPSESQPSTSLVRASPSLEREGSETGRRTLKPGSPPPPPPLVSNIARAPSMPASLLGAEEVQDEEEEIEFSMGKLIRQASLKSSDAVPRPRIHAPKGATAVISGSTSSRKAEFGNRKLERLRPRRVMNQLKTQKSLSDLESFELQGFKDLGFDVGVRNSRQGAISMIPESHEEEDQGRNVPKRGGKRSNEDDMKAQIKFWARAVASNVNKE